jgi:hypothetical protein
MLGNRILYIVKIKELSFKPLILMTDRHVFAHGLPRFNRISAKLAVGVLQRCFDALS